MYDLIIIGSGPAGLTAAIYAQRALLNTVLFEKDYGGTGQIAETAVVDNYPGLPKISGYDLGEKFREHAISLGAKIIEEEVISIKKISDGFEIKTSENEKSYETKTIIYAAGAAHRHTGCKGEEEFGGRGVSYCATCDGAFYKGKTVTVIGGGDTALGDALYLSNLAEKVYLVHRRDEFRANKLLQKKVFEKENIEPVYSAIPYEIKGDKKVNAIVLTNKKTGENFNINTDGIFVAVGNVPNTQIISEYLPEVELENGYIKANESGITTLDGFFVAGDVRTTPLRQVITAAADGAKAVESVSKYIG